MATTEDVDAVGVYGPLDVGGSTVYVSRWGSDTYDGRAIVPGPWYHVHESNGESFGLINAPGGTFYAFEPFLAGVGLGDEFPTLEEAIRRLVEKKRPR